MSYIFSARPVENRRRAGARDEMARKRKTDRNREFATEREASIRKRRTNAGKILTTHVTQNAAQLREVPPLIHLDSVN